ncbi:hypothetical protein M3603_15340 [Rummeliibacillus stabekisii]|uniref:hypothetical protein n=1 Tax=Rummeliibacillus stabekisii TaxID=241244 RepID=UPI00203E4A0F|nr:hypothetical protein [Rummeliibacillus stabekisii]MCM3317992.1 hypothetical protein [Rummeliibacillus stabekisii]
MNSVTLQELMTEVSNEKEYLQYGTTYRKETVRLAEQVLSYVHDVKPFLRRDIALAYVGKVLNVNTERQKDVAKMLNVIVNDLYLRKNMSDELLEGLAERRKNRGSLKLKLVLN